MFSILNLSFEKFVPRFGLTEMLRRKRSIHQNSIDLEEMPESWQRDLGLKDGRDRRGRPDEGAFRAARMIYSQRNL
ncbi:hypothetical protein [Rhizobium terrae]|uniref:hypothetical protein n=1 Tax=Rhizobium terrae TaxID=2171756 RepID=UPI000E3B7239|nr:hypothetical protein [Rhizobium terrae]